MRLLNYMVNSAYRLSGVLMMLVGLGIIVLAFLNSPLQLQITLGLIGLGFISLGAVQLKRGQDEKKLDRIIDKLDEIEQELKKEKQPEGGSTAIADIIYSGLKYYADRMQDKESE